MSDVNPRRWLTRAWLERAGTVLLVLVTVRYQLMFFHRGANLLDEGSQVAMANRILHGDVIYRDFLTVATPGSFYTVAWLFQLFGTELMVVRSAIVALNLGILVVVLIIARRLMSWPFAAASALLSVVWGWFLVAPNLYSLQGMFFALVALACYLHAARTSGTWLFLAGLACGAAMMVKQNIGVYAAVALSIASWGSLRRHWYFLAGHRAHRDPLTPLLDRDWGRASPVRKLDLLPAPALSPRAHVRVSILLSSLGPRHVAEARHLSAMVGLPVCRGRAGHGGGSTEAERATRRGPRRCMRCRRSRSSGR